METVEYKNISFTVWDVGGQDKVHIFNSCLDHSIVSSSYFMFCIWFYQAAQHVNGLA